MEKPACKRAGEMNSTAKVAKGVSAIWNFFEQGIFMETRQGKTK
jgi:hypothetical protein